MLPCYIVVAAVMAVAVAVLVCAGGSVAAAALMSWRWCAGGSVVAAAAGTATAPVLWRR